MSERDDCLLGGKKPFAKVVNAEGIINPDGSEAAVFEIAGNCPRAMGELGEEIIRQEVGRRGSSRSFGLSGSWKNCNWDPPKPKENWQKPPKDPSLN